MKIYPLQADLYCTIFANIIQFLKKTPLKHQFRQYVANFIKIRHHAVNYILPRSYFRLKIRPCHLDLLKRHPFVKSIRRYVHGNFLPSSCFGDTADCNAELLVTWCHSSIAPENESRKSGFFQGCFSSRPTMT